MFSINTPILFSLSNMQNIRIFKSKAKNIFCTIFFCCLFCGKSIYMFVLAKNHNIWCVLPKKYPPNNRWETEPEKTDYVFMHKCTIRYEEKKVNSFLLAINIKEKKYGK